jgi:hypothetical protein
MDRQCSKNGGTRVKYIAYWWENHKEGRPRYATEPVRRKEGEKKRRRERRGEGRWGEKTGDRRGENRREKRGEGRGGE